MSTLHAVVYNDPFDGPRPQLRSRWWRRMNIPAGPEGHRFVLQWLRPRPWNCSLEFYDKLAVQLPVDAFKVIEHEPITELTRLGDRIILARQAIWIDILAPFPPTITGWETLTWGGEHAWPGLGKRAYEMNYGGLRSYVAVQSSP